ncbi:fimbria/pilus periplasmic chaperone [Vibrio sp. SCSIO 43140]|uniref:fimbrial biogenesis chaperone n=1 Tax=Vibrio sp. SCSIO 43140 TaxID=2819100 RepID=UPI002075EED0|nr:fimbria/pilus periplasmic chaperone [Vibrio sp. SCSIO 43140]USD61316.1 fimbria/pilus periplasmic chaperone [Vibrio sp. SCSIO 43140]
MKISILLLIVFCSSSWANIVMTGSRVIYNEGQRFVNVNLSNKSENVFFVQSWVDETEDSDEKSEYYVVTPPIARLAPNSGQIIRVISIDESAYPRDRESISYFNFLQIPTNKSLKKELDSVNKLFVTVKHKVKLFYRPLGIKDFNDQPEKMIRVTMVESDDASVKIRVYNDRPFYLSMSGNIGFIDNGTEIKTAGRMIEPYSYRDFDFDKSEKMLDKLHSGIVEFRMVSDLGALLSMRFDVVSN